jgi:serine/threonine protein phosphatase PrpC
MAEPSEKRQKTSDKSYIPRESHIESDISICSERIFMLKNRKITCNQCIIQMSSKQDHAVSGEGIDILTNEKFTFHAIFDGHGTDSCINFIRNLNIEDMSEIMATEDPVETLSNYITDSKTVPISRNSSGSTMCMVRVYNNRLESFNCGDSQAIIFINGKEEYRTAMHNYANIEERIRVAGKNYQYVFKVENNKFINLKTPILSDTIEDIRDITDNGLGVKFTVSKGVTMVDKDNIRANYSERATFGPTTNFPFYLSLSPTQALGHNSRTGYSKSKHVIYLKETDSVKIVIASDGVWDMRVPNSKDSGMDLVPLTSKEIAMQCRERWTQPWIMTTLGTSAENPARVLPQKMKLRDFDDVSVIVVESKPGKKDSEEGNGEGAGEGLGKEPEEGAGEYKKDGTGTKRRSTKRRSTKRRSTKRRSTKRRSTKRRSTKRR